MLIALNNWAKYSKQNQYSKETTLAAKATTATTNSWIKLNWTLWYNAIQYEYTDKFAVINRCRCRCRLRVEKINCENSKWRMGQDLNSIYLYTWVWRSMFLFYDVFLPISSRSFVSLFTIHCFTINIYNTLIGFTVYSTDQISLSHFWSFCRMRKRTLISFEFRVNHWAANLATETIEAWGTHASPYSWARYLTSLLEIHYLYRVAENRRRPEIMMMKQKCAKMNE